MNPHYFQVIFPKNVGAVERGLSTPEVRPVLNSCRTQFCADDDGARAHRGDQGRFLVNRSAETWKATTKRRGKKLWSTASKMILHTRYIILYGTAESNVILTSINNGLYTYTRTSVWWTVFTRIKSTIICTAVSKTVYTALHGIEKTRVLMTRQRC